MQWLNIHCHPRGLHPELHNGLQRGGLVNVKHNHLLVQKLRKIIPTATPKLGLSGPLSGKTMMNSMKRIK